jgi:hypothetical protein
MRKLLRGSMDLLLVSRRIGRVYIDVIRSNCQIFLTFPHSSAPSLLEVRLRYEDGEQGLTGVEMWKVGESKEV